MPLTKATPEVIDVDKLSKNIKSNNVSDGVRAYVDTNVTTLNSTIDGVSSTLTQSISDNVGTLNSTIATLATTTSTAITGLQTILVTQLVQDIVKRFALPIGSMMLWPTDTIMPNLNDYGTYVALNGQFLLKADYPELYLLLKNGTSVCVYGENATQFKVPNFSGRVPCMYGATYDTNVFTLAGLDIGFFGGEYQHISTIPEMPTHSHTYQKTNGGTLVGIDGAPGGNVVNITTGTTGDSGSGQPHNVMQPFLVTNIIIKAKHAPSIVY